jgi:hypothetical protein
VDIGAAAQSTLETQKKSLRVDGGDYGEAKRPEGQRGVRGAAAPAKKIRFQRTYRK